jgi:dTDP-4-amino-4,6-dideoxygalactose transaminase
VKQKLTKRTKLVIPVHFAARHAKGFERFPVPILFDSAHRVARNDFKGTTSCYSFYAVKNMTTVRGGMILTNDDKAAAWYRKAVHGGLGKDTLSRYAGQQDQKDVSSFYYEVEFPGWNFDMTDVEAAIGRVQLTKLPGLNNKREALVRKYNSAFGLKNTGNHLYPILVENRNEFLLAMREANIQCGIHYLPLHLMRGYASYRGGKLPVTEYVGARCVSIPLYADMTAGEVLRVTRAVKRHAKLAQFPKSK